MSEWKGNVRNINENKLMVAECKKSLKELMEQTQNQSNIVNLKKNKLKTFNKKKDEVNRNIFSTENKINNLKNRLEGIENKTNEINKFLNTILNDKILEQKKYKELSSYLLTIKEKIKKKKIYIHLKKN